ncbi:MAG: ATP-dependent sacrificial sulfur transferase LarE [Candidatus Brocadiae bacterium]|nr:ATP-dependent sacrificial sulfur transferase LarE [Candidatus Brocadiia bacterium]
MERLDSLRQLIGGLPSAVVAYSGGVDSTLVAAVAHAVLGPRAVAVLAVSESLAADDEASAAETARAAGFPVRTIRTHELDRGDYAKNPPNRCWFCKSELYDELVEIARREGIAAVLDGQNLDDVGDWRPGARAATEHAVRSPLREAGFTKADVRAAARELGLPNWDKPAAPCLSSRFPYGTAITPEKLKQVGDAEAFLRRLGFREFRVRHHEAVARIEVGAGDMPRVLEQRDAIARGLRDLGYTWVSLELEPLRSGSMNRVLKT